MLSIAFTILPPQTINGFSNICTMGAAGEEHTTEEGRRDRSLDADRIYPANNSS